MVSKILQKVNKIFKNNSDNIFDTEHLKSLPFSTPYFLFSKKKLTHNYQEFKKLFPNSLIFYAMKANSEPEILQTLHNIGSGFEVASKYELDMLKKLQVPAEKIIYGTSTKSSTHIKEFKSYGIDRFAFDSLPELEKIAQVAPKSKVYVRTIANDSGSVFKFSEKFGTDHDNIIPLLKRAKELKLEPYGISFNVGSQASDPMAWANVIISLRSIIQELKKDGLKLEILNIGGGYPTPYVSSELAPTHKEIAENTIKQFKKLPYPLKLVLEPGRGMVADAGVAVATVIARVERRASTWLFLDLGVYNGLFETMAYQGSTRYPITSMRSAGDNGESLFSLAGPTGDSPDVITREALLPNDIEIGDKLIFHLVGAYSLTTVSPFNGFPKPEVYYV